MIRQGETVAISGRKAVVTATFEDCVVCLGVEDGHLVERVVALGDCEVEEATHG